MRKPQTPTYLYPLPMLAFWRFLVRLPSCPWGLCCTRECATGRVYEKIRLREQCGYDKMIDSLRLGPSIHPFSLLSPLPRPTFAFLRPSLIPEIGTCQIRGCAKCLWSCGSPTSCAGGPPPNRQAFCTQSDTGGRTVQAHPRET